MIGFLILFLSFAQTSARQNEVTVQQNRTEIATLAGGCFWGMEELFRSLPGVITTRVGYCGGLTENPTYDLVKTGKTGHAESLEIQFDPQKISYESLLLLFFRIHDPTHINRQGNDIGTQYRSAIFYHNEDQRKIAESVIDRVNLSGKWPKPVATNIERLITFWPAESYHQRYLEKHPNGYTCHFDRGFSF